MVSAIPKGFNTATPSLLFEDAAKAIETYKKAFGAKEIERYNFPDTDKIMHAVIEIGNSKFMVGNETPDMPASKNYAQFYLYVDDADAAMEQAKKAGLKETMPIEDMFWGDRLGAVADEYGFNWTIATHTRDLSKDELDKSAREFMKKWKEKEGKKAA